MKFDDETICNAINISWSIAHEADNVKDSLRRWIAVINELRGIDNLLNWSVESDKDRKLVVNELTENIILLKRIANYHAYGI